MTPRARVVDPLAKLVAKYPKEVRVVVAQFPSASISKLKRRRRWPRTRRGASG